MGAVGHPTPELTSRSPEEDERMPIGVRLLPSASSMEESPTRTLRRTLEGALSTHVASTVLFEALSEAGAGVPRTADEVLAVVRGPLRDVLDRRLDPTEVALLLAQLETALTPLAPKEPPTVQVSIDDIVDELDEREADATTPFSTAHHAVRVLVLAAGTGFSRRLEVTLGSGRVCPIPVQSPLGLAEVLKGEPASIVVLDATDFPAIEQSAILSAGFAVPRTTACVVWGADLPYGKSFVRAVEGQSRRWVFLEMKEGIPPLLDLIASRRRARR